MSYPKRINGNEYYSKHLTKYLKNNDGDEIYAIDRHGNEKYLKRTSGNIFVRNRYGKQRYARNVRGDEIYPMIKNMSVVMYEKGEPILTRNRFGDATYPVDKKGNEYYVLHFDNRPLLALDRNGLVIVARSRKNVELIPTNMIEMVRLKVGSDIKFKRRLDAAGNIVYVRDDVEYNRGVERCIFLPLEILGSVCGIIWCCLI